MPNPDGASFSISITAGPAFWIGVGLLALTAITAGVWLARRTDFLARLSRHLRRWAPLYLVLGPPAVTYILVCGFCSMVYHSSGIGPLDLSGMSRDEMLSSSGFRGLYVIEWACSAVGACMCAWLVRWLRLPAFWYGVIAASMSLTAVYRTAACRPNPYGSFDSGPEILLSPTLTDAIPVLVGLGVCLAWQTRPLSRLTRRRARP